MKTWGQLARLAKSRGFKLVHRGHSASLISHEDKKHGIGYAASTVTWWRDDKRTRDAMLRAMIEAALGATR